MRRGRAPWLYVLCVFGLLALSLALALHILPGFNNPKLLDQVTFGQSVIPFNLYANYDKAVVGLVLLIMLNRSSLWGTKDGGIAPGQIDAGVSQRWSQQTLCWAVPLMCFGVTVLAFAMGLPLDVKLSSSILVFYWANLLFTCVAEEAFFRLLIQDNIVWVGRRYLGLRGAHGLALVVVTLLFLLAHTGGVLQIKQAVLIGVSGFLYAWVYHKSGKLQWAIAIHFGVNAMHITFLRYPMVF